MFLFSFLSGFRASAQDHGYKNTISVAIRQAIQLTALTSPISKYLWPLSHLETPHTPPASKTLRWDNPRVESPDFSSAEVMSRKKLVLRLLFRQRYLNHVCPTQREAIIYYNHCTLRYSDCVIFSQTSHSVEHFCGVTITVLGPTMKTSSKNWCWPRWSKQRTVLDISVREMPSGKNTWICTSWFSALLFWQKIINRMPLRKIGARLSIP